MMNFKLTSLLILLLVSTALHAQTADEVIEKYISFTGGTAAWKKIRTLESSGTYNYGGLIFPFHSFALAPDRYKYIVSAKGKSFVQAFDGKTGWRIDGFKNEKKKTILHDKQAVEMANESDVTIESPFVDYQKKGNKVKLLGREKVNNIECFKISLAPQNGDTAIYFFDSSSYALIKKQAPSKNAELNHSMLDINYGDFKLQSGVKIPFKISCVSNGQEILIISVKQVKINGPVSETIFNP